GLLPAFRASRADPVEVFRRGGDRGSTGVPAAWAQTLMLVGQMAGCVILIVITSLLVRTFLRLENEPLGFDARHLSVAHVVLPNDAFDSSEKRNAFYRQLADRVRALPGVRAAAAGTSALLNSGPPVTVNTTSQDLPTAPRISAQDVTTEFFE